MDRELILLIETSTEACSAALAEGTAILEEIYLEEPKAHASVLAPFIEGLLKRNGISAKNLKAVAVSQGPGSYTGLRVGVSIAKGICYAAQVPLIGVNTLAAIAQSAIDSMQGETLSELIVPMIDARRMEVFTADYSADGRELTPTIAKVLTSESYAENLKRGKVLFTGNGATKFADMLKEEGAANLGNFILKPQMPKASGMRIIAKRALSNADFKDVAYFEPFYLKEFVAGKPKKLL